MNTRVAALLTATLTFTLFGCASPSADTPVSTPPSAAVPSVAFDAVESEEASAQEPNAGPGSYITLAEYDANASVYASTDVVLFFNAEWCSTCKVARDNIESNLAGIPAGLTIVKVDFDTENDLRQKYGVTVQHTYVQVDQDGNELAKWSGSVTAEEIAENTV